MDSLFINNKFAEYEVRVALPGFAIYDKIIKYLISEKLNVAVYRSLAIVESNGYRQIINFNDKLEKINEEFQIKKPLITPKTIENVLPTRIHLTTETPTTKFIPSNTAIYRFRYRFSFEINSWRIDVTATKSGNFSSNASKLKNIKLEFFDEKNIEVAATNYELEYEWITRELPTQIVDFEYWNKLMLLIDDKHNEKTKYLLKLNEVANLFHLNKRNITGLKNITTNVQTLNKFIYKTTIFPPIDWFCTEKMDGNRCVIWAKTNESVLHGVSDCYQTWKTQKPFSCNLVADCEMIIVKNQTIISVFDIMVWGGEYFNQDFDKRCSLINEVVEFINKLNVETIKVKSKKYIVLTSDYANQLNLMATQKYDYEIDGLILTHPNGNYLATKHYKWKPSTHNTIDFLVRLNEIQNLPLHYIYTLYVSASNNQIIGGGGSKVNKYNSVSDIVAIPFKPSANPFAHIWTTKIDDHSNLLNDGKTPNFDNLIVEMLYTGDPFSKPRVNDWKPQRIRWDRRNMQNYFGNNVMVAELNYMNYIDVFGLQELCDPGKIYFEKIADTQYKLANIYKRFVVGELIQQYCNNAKWVIDAAGGRGADINRYITATVKNCLFTDIDTTALVELISRKYNMINTRKLTNKFNINVLQLNLSDDIAVNHTKCSVFTDLANTIVCNFAFHYLCDSRKSLRNMLGWVSKTLCSNGYFTLTTFDGKLIFDLLKKTPENNWTSESGKYSIKSLKPLNANMLEVGEEIAVKLPMNTEMLIESLANYDYIVAEAKKLHLICITRGNFGDHYGKFEKTNSQNILSEEDKHYINLHGFMVFTKK